MLPIKDIAQWAHDVGVRILVDACQSVPHMVVDIQNLGVDFLVASSHKMCGPTGIGFLYGKSELLVAMPPFLGGGEMISDIFLDHSTYADLHPDLRLEHLQLGKPLVWEQQLIFSEKIHDYEVELTDYLYENLHKIPGVCIYGPAPSQAVHRAALWSFNVEGLHPTDIATFVDKQIWSPLCTAITSLLGINASAPSLYFYNTKEDVDNFVQGLVDTIAFFSSFK